MTGDITVRTSNSPDEVLLTLNNKIFEQNAIYTLQMDGELTSAYGVNLNDGYGDNMKFTASSDAAEVFALEQIIPFDSKTLLLDFNKEINPFLATQIYNFYITNENGNPIKVFYDADIDAKTLILKFDSLTDSDNSYTIRYNKLKDYSGTEGTQGEALVRLGNNFCKAKFVILLYRYCL